MIKRSFDYIHALIDKLQQDDTKEREKNFRSE